MKILFIGDIVGRSGRKTVHNLLPQLQREYQWDLCVANAENAAGGKGLTQAVADELKDIGIDILTMGNHTWDNREIYSFIDQADYLVRPANYPGPVPGRGWLTITVRGRKVAVVNLSGQAFMGPYNCPFATIDALLGELADCQHILVDFHAEATAEKVAMGYYLDGRVDAVVGTHTHIQTADEGKLPKGTLYITDVGMTGPRHSVLGMEVEPVLEKFTTKLPRRFTAARGPGLLGAVWLDLDQKIIKRISLKE